jgi:hypothetical protein
MLFGCLILLGLDSNQTYLLLLESLYKARGGIATMEWIAACPKLKVLEYVDHDPHSRYQTSASCSCLFLVHFTNWEEELYTPL